MFSGNPFCFGRKREISTTARREPHRCGVLGLITSIVLAVAEGRAANVGLPEVLTGGVFDSATATGDSSAPVLAAAARYVAFVSAAENLVPNDHNHALDVFWWDRDARRTLLVSLSADGQHSASGPSAAPSISADGRFVAFMSRASGLVSGATNGVENVFLRDMLSGMTTLISVNKHGSAGNQPSLNPQITPDGRFVVFESQASDLVPNDANDATDVFVRDVVARRTILVSMAADNTGSGLGYSSNPAITPDGRWVALESIAANLAGNDRAATSDVFCRDLLTGTTVLVSVGLSGAAAGNAKHATISDDGRFIAFESSAGNLVAGDRDTLNDIFLRDMQTGITSQLSLGSEFDAATNAPTGAVISHDGRLVAFQTGQIPRRGMISAGQVYVWDGRTSSLVLVSVSSDGSTPGAGFSYGPIISADDRFITFLSSATNLVANATSHTFQVYQRDLVAGRTRLLSPDRAGDGNASDCSGLSVSDDGRWAAFASRADNLVPDDRNEAYDVFLRDAEGGIAELVSTTAIDLTLATPPGWSGFATRPLSADGRYLVFSSLAPGLVANDPNGTTDVFRRDLLSGTNLLVSVNTNGLSGNGSSLTPAVSADGRFVAFASQATDLTGGVTNRKGNIFIRDLWSNTTALVSVSLAGLGGDGVSRNPAISADGSRVAFESLAKDLVLDATWPYNSEIFVHHRLTRSNVLVSVRVGGLGTHGDVLDPLISDDGRFVIFAWAANAYACDLALGQTFPINLDTQTTPHRIRSGGVALSRDGRFLAYTGGSNVYRLDLFLQTNVLISAGGANASVDGSGRFVAFEKPLYDPSAPLVPTNTAILVWDSETRSETLASANTANTATANKPARWPVLSPDARFVVFTSQASDLGATGPALATEVFARDLVLGRTWCLSQPRPSEDPARLVSTAPQFGPDGRTVLFQSYDSDLAAADFNGTADLFVVRILVEDRDRDGLDDDWEMAHFGTLVRDGTGDFDDDTVGDSAEFRAGTDPTNQGSVFRAFAVASLTEGRSTVYWSASPGHTYRVQALDAVGNSQWADLAGTVLASSTTATLIDETSTGASRRFYRVMLVSP